MSYQLGWQPQQPPPPKEKRKWHTVVAVAAAALASGLATAGVMTVASGGEASVADCEAALTSAEGVFETYQGAFLDVADAIEAYDRSDYSAMTRHTNSLSDSADDAETGLFEYYEAKEECLGK